MGNPPSMIAPPTGRPAGPPPEPVIATTGNARADSVLATLDAAIAPFRSAPPADQGAAGWVAQGLGGALGVINAPMMFIDAAASQGVSAILDALGLSGLFPPMPVATIGLSLHVGTPHTHVHPPSLVPPAPPIPLPSLGVAFLAGSASVLVGGVPALRAGDIGIGFTCGSMAPPFEIMTGASGVYFAGSRVARFGMDITFHCNPASPMGGFAIGMGVAGVVAGAAGAAAQASAGNSGAAIAQGIQAGLDAAAMAVSMLRGKDPAGPPGIGMLVGPPMGNVVAGGPPIPNIGALAQGKIYSALGRALRSMRGRMRRRSPAPDSNGRTCEGGEPVHVVTGANYNTYLDFASVLGGFRWTRYCSSGDHATRGVMGWGWRHALESRLSIRLHRITFQGHQGESIEFPRLRGEQDVAMHGYRLRLVGDDKYVVSHRRLGELTFQRDGRGSGTARLVAMRTGETTVELTYDRHRRLEAIVERTRENGTSVSATYSLKYDSQGQLSAVWGSRFGEPPVRLVHYQHDLLGNLVIAEDSAGARDEYRYDHLHRMVRAQDRNRYAFSWEYDHEGRCAKTHGEDGLWFAAFAYEPGLTTMTIHDGSAYQFEYDEDGVITKVIGPCGSVKKRERDPSGRVLAEVDEGGTRIAFVYDEDGGLIARRNVFGREFPPSLEASGVPQTLGRDLPHDPRGFLFGRIVPPPATAEAPVTRKLDRLGNVVSERDGAGHERKWTYDAAGYETSRVDRDGRVYRNEIVSWGQVGARIDPLGHATRYEYNPHQKITRVVDPGGTEIEYEYDSHDRVIEVRRHGTVHARYRRDKAHRLVEKQDGDGDLMLWITRHENGLVKRIDRRDGGWAELDYDVNGRATVADTADHVVRRKVTFFDEIEREDCDGRTVVHEYGWGGAISTTIADRFHCTRERHGSTIVLTDPTGRRRILRTDPDGSVFITHANGTHEAQRYDADGRLLGRASTRRGSDGEFGNDWNVALAYTPEGDLVAIRDNRRGDRTYEMDAAHRLVRVRESDGSTQDYRYDAAGNLVSNPRAGVVRLDSGNRLHTAAAERFQYDDRDRIASRDTTSAAPVRYIYDDEDQLVRVEDGAGDPWTATYDALGRRVTFGRGTARTRLWWDGDRVAARECPGGTLRIFLYADPTSLTPLGFVDYDSVDADPASGRSYSVFCDQVGLPQHIEDDRGHVVWWADRATPYGEVFVRPGNAIEYHLRFPGHIYDPDLQLHYNRFRDYDPRLGRYLQPDPLGIRGGVNLYAYTPNPLVSVDVLGLAPNHSNPDNGPSRGEDGEGRPLTDDPNAADAAPPMRLTREQAEARAREAADDYRRQVNEAFARGELDGFDPNVEGTLAPACVAAVVDQRTGQTHVGHNQPSGDGAVPVNPNDYHPVLRDRIASQQSPQDGQTGHPSEPGSHAEVLALDRALKARDEAHAQDPSIPPASADNLGEFTQLPMWAREPQTSPHMTPGNPAACCGNCAPITSGTNNMSGDPAPAWVWRDGGWQRPPR